MTTSERLGPGAPPHDTVITRRGSDGSAPLSFPQERLFLLDRMMPGLGAYNVPTLVRVRATLDEERLQAAFELVGAHGLGGWTQKPRATEDVDVVVVPPDVVEHMEVERVRCREIGARDLRRRRRRGCCGLAGPGVASRTASA